MPDLEVLYMTYVADHMSQQARGLGVVLAAHHQDLVKVDDGVGDTVAREVDQLADAVAHDVQRRGTPPVHVQLRRRHLVTVPRRAAGHRPSNLLHQAQLD